MILDEPASLKNRKVRRAAGIFTRFVMLVVLGITAFISAPVLLTLGSYCYFQLTEEILPGIAVGGVPVGGLRSAEAARDLHKTWNKDLQLKAVDITNPSHSWEITPSELGLRVAVDESVANAYALGRSGHFVESVGSMLAILKFGAEIDPLVELDLVSHGRFVQRFREAVDYFSGAARAEDLPKYVGNFHQVERDLLVVEETDIELPNWI